MLDQAVRAKREALVREHMASENDLDFKRTMATFSHPRYEIIPSGAVIDGKEAVDRYFIASRRVFPDQRNELISLRHADDAVIVEFWLLGTQRGKLGNIEPTGREIRVQMTAFYLFDDDGIVCERVYFDQGTILRQLGVAEEVA
jgi:predicted ester cyclase